MSNEKDKLRPRILGDRPPTFVKKATLAAELDISESSVENYVQAGILPRPRKFLGAVRWRWADVEARLLSGDEQSIDPFLAGLKNVEASPKSSR